MHLLAAFHDRPLPANPAAGALPIMSAQR